ncbi:MAG: flippase [Nitrospiraceae bacterium]|nr:flippase [Nitrospiraceae bacterium]OQW65667.1 MAG: hypothetical protein BVN29_08550 [Nitrospira sp. ST-bin5]
MKMALGAIGNPSASMKHDANRGGERISVARGTLESGAVLLCASVFGNGLNYFFMLFLARQLGMEEFGLYALGVTLFNTALLVGCAGLDTGVIKFVSAYMGQGRVDDARRVIATAVTIVTLLGVVAGIGFWAMAASLSTQLYQKPGLAVVLLCFAPALVFALVGAVLLAALQAFQTVRYTVALKYFWEPVGKWVTAGIAIWAGWGLSGVVLGWVVVFGVTACLAGAVLARQGRLGVTDFAGLGRSEVRTLVTYSAPLLLANLFGVVAPRADVMLLGYWVSAGDVGVYLAAFQTAAVLALILGALDVVFAPAISRAWAANDRLTFQESYAMVHRVAFTATVPLCVLLVLFADDVLRVFGSGFAAGGSILAVLAVGHLVNASSGCANTVLLMSGHSRIVLINTVGYGTLLIGATAAMIPVWGPSGAAFAASGSFVLLNGVRVAQVWRLHRMLPWTRAIVKPLAAGGMMGLAIWLLKPYLATAAYLPLGVMACALYIAVLYVARLESDDALILTALAARVRMAAGWAR